MQEVPREPLRLRRTRAAPPRHRGAHRHDARASHGSGGDALGRRERSPRVRSSGPPGSSRAPLSPSWACRSTRPGGSSSTPTMRVEPASLTGAGDARGLGDRRLRRRPRPRPPGQPCPPTAQHAIRQGRLVARNVVATLGGGRAQPFRYRTKGVVAELGHNQAVAITLGIRWRGLPAWLIARTYHLLLMPGMGRRLRLLADWNVALLFGRDAVLARTPGQPDAAGRRNARVTLPDVAAAAYPESRMAIAEQIKTDLQGAMRAGEKDKVGALRLVLSELQKAAKEGSDDELAVLRRERKRRLEAAQRLPRRRPRGSRRGRGGRGRADRRLPARRALRRRSSRRSSSRPSATAARESREGHGRGDEAGDGRRRRPRRRQARLGPRAGRAAGMRTQIELSNEVAAELAGSQDAVLRALEAHLDCQVFLRGNLLTFDGEESETHAGERVVRELSELIARGHQIGPGTITRRHRRARRARVARARARGRRLAHRGLRVAPKTRQPEALRRLDPPQHDHLRRRPGRHRQDLPGGRDGRRRALAPRGQPHHPHAPRRRGGRAARLPAGRPDGEGRPLPAPAVRRAARHARPREGLPAHRARRDRDRAAGVHARAHAQRLVRDPRRGAEHDARADEDVPHAARLRLADGRHRRHHAGRPAARAAVGADRRRRRARRVEGIEFVRFGGEDVVRHKLVQRIVEAYDVHSQREAPELRLRRPPRLAAISQAPERPMLEVEVRRHASARARRRAVPRERGRAGSARSPPPARGIDRRASRDRVRRRATRIAS